MSTTRSLSISELEQGAHMIRIVSEGMVIADVIVSYHPRFEGNTTYPSRPAQLAFAIESTGVKLDCVASRGANLHTDL